MKKILTLLLLATLLLTACNTPAPPIDNATTTASTGEESTTPADNDTTLPDDTDTTVPDDTDTTVPDDTDTTVPDDTDTTVPDDTDTTVPDDTDTTITDCTGSGSNGFRDVTVQVKSLADFYTLLKTKSTNPDDCEEPIRWLEKCVNQLIETNVLITLDDVGIKSQELLEKLDCVKLGFKTDFDGNYYGYSYAFENNCGVRVLYNPELLIGMNESNPYTIIDSRTKLNEGGFLAWLAAPKPIWQNHWCDNVYWETIDDCFVYYYSQTVRSSIRWDVVYVIIDGFAISIHYYNSENIDMTGYDDFLLYFSEDTYQDAIRQLIANVRNRE